MTSWHTVWLVASREITTRARSKSYLLTTGLLVGAVVLGGVVLRIALDPGAATRIGVTSSTAALADPLRAIGRAGGGGDGGDNALEPVRLEGGAAERAVRDGEVEAALIGPADDFTVVVQSELDPFLSATLTVLRQQAALASAVTDLGGDPAAVQTQLAGATLTVKALKPPPERTGAQLVAGYVAGILLFLALQAGGQFVAQGVVEEKSSRVVELLLSTIRPWQLMAGKVLGIGVISLVQVALVVTGGAGTALALDLVDPGALDLGSTVLWALLWFVVGYLMYALVLAALASLVSRQEEVGAVITPVIILMVIPYMVGISIAPFDPDNTLVRVLSYVPFCSPLVMPIRIALGTVATWQVVLALALSLVLVPGLVWLAGRVYSGAVLRTGARVALRDALRA
ncbi:MAG TPA: ABC transporter permease [Dermatophilaceae bacterium]|nr:ABC transporter permease [Dermatophilaceae bacterium]